MSSMARRDRRVCIALHVIEVSGNDTQKHITRDLSCWGMYLTTSKRWPLKSTVHFQLAHRTFDVIIEAQVVRDEKEGVAFEFINVSPAQRDQLRSLVNGLLADGAWLCDRRSSIRKHVNGPVVWRVGGIEFESSLRDLSASGAFIETDEPPPEGTRVLVYLPSTVKESSGEESFAAQGCEAVVRRRETEGFGVEFLSASADFSKALTELLQPHD